MSREACGSRTYLGGVHELPLILDCLIPVWAAAQNGEQMAHPMVRESHPSCNTRTR